MFLFSESAASALVWLTATGSAGAAEIGTVVAQKYTNKHTSGRGKLYKRVISSF